MIRDQPYPKDHPGAEASPAGWTPSRTGLPSRAEVTDAAMAQRAECVMLNKGPFINEAISVLDDILGRMQDHTRKKRSLLRRLRAWER